MTTLTASPHAATLDALAARLDEATRRTDRAYGTLLNVRRQVAAAQARESLRLAGRCERMPVEFRSQFGEDLVAWSLLGRPTTGFFIEVGAFDGVTGSVTFALEAMGWNGLLIEAIPERAAQCLAARPHSRVVHAALSRPGSPALAEFRVVQDDHGGMLSFAPADTDSLHAAQVESQRYATRTVSVPSTTMDALLEGHEGKVDLAVIDVEGAEPALLAGFDLSRWKPRVLCIEDNTRGRSPALDAAMAPHPYRLVAWVECSRVYVHRDESAAVERLRSMV